MYPALRPALTTLLSKATKDDDDELFVAAVMDASVVASPDSPVKSKTIFVLAAREGSLA
jgi:hypothetical protein